jgi:hypothetical protein
MTRILVLMDASAGDGAIVLAANDVADRLAESGLDVEVVDCRVAFYAYEHQIGGKIRGHRWADWVNHASLAFDGFVRPYDRTIGRVNGEVIQTAIRMGKPAIFLPHAGVPQQITGVQTVEPDNYKAGWRLVIRPR